jgi:hypothetical protein
MIQLKYRILSGATRRVFEGDGGSAASAEGTATQTTTTTTPPPPTTTTQQPTQRTFTQTELNNLIQARVSDVQRKAAEANKATVERLQALQQDQQLTQQQRDTLQAQIEELQAMYQTAEETKKLEIDKLSEKYKKDTSTLAKERDTWKSQYDSHFVEVAISRAAVKYDAVSPEQIEAFLRPITKVTEKLEDGKPTGRFTTRVRFEDTDAEGKPIVLELDADAAVKLMRERPNRFGNLFKNATGGGTGTTINPNPGGSQSLDISRMSPADYRKNRTALFEQMRAQRANQ